MRFNTIASRQNAGRTTSDFQLNNGLVQDGITDGQTLGKKNDLIAEAKKNDLAKLSGDLHVGSKGESVKQIQSALKQLGYYNDSIDSYYGQITKNAVLLFQINYGIQPDGIVGNQTKLTISDALRNTLRNGSNGDTVEHLQKNLIKLGFDTKSENGIFEQNTKEAVIAFQKAYGLRQDGIVGPQTNYRMNQALLSTSANSDLLKMGSKGEAVRKLQQDLTAIGYDTKGADGDFGQNTYNAVVAFQKAYGLDADGIVGTQTKNKMQEVLANKNNNNSDLLKMGSKGEAVRKLQQDLTAIGYDTKGVDGDFGQNTYNAVVAFQKAYGLGADGIVGPQTKNKIQEVLANKNNSNSDLLKMGSKGEAVRKLQQDLTAIGYDTKGADGDFGQNTYNAVVAFQKAYGLGADGIVGPQTKNKIQEVLANKNNNNSDLLKMGSKGEAVRKLQQDLTAIGYDTKGADGDFGQNTYNAVVAFQKAYGLSADGIVGPQTKNKIQEVLANKNNNNSELLKMGSKGEAVRKLQQDLTAIGYDTKGADGDFGQNTYNAIVAFQKAYGLDADGIVGVQTRSKLNEVLRTHGSGNASNIGTMVYYSQEDSRWKNIMYSNHGDRSQTIGTSGCGTTSMAMVVSTLTRSEVQPPELCDYAVKNGFRTYNDGTSWGFFKSASNKYGIECSETSSLDSVKNALSDGKHIVIASMSPGHFTGSGHFIVLNGVENTDGTTWYNVFDPNIDNTSYRQDGKIQEGIKNDGKVKARSDVFLAEANRYWIFSKDNVDINPPSGSIGNMQVSDNGVKFISNYEGFSQYKYRGLDDGNWTIGYGHVIEPGENYDNGISEPEARALLKKELNVRYGKAVNDFAKKYNIKLTQNQFDALISFTYNVGTGVWNRSEDDFKLKKLIVNNNLNSSEIQEAFTRWIKVTRANGTQVNSAGLWRRRMDEAELFNSGNYTRDNRTAPNGYV